MADHEAQRLRHLMHQCPPHPSPAPDLAGRAKARAGRMRRNRHAGYAGAMAAALVALGVPVGMHLTSGTDNSSRLAAVPGPLATCPVTQPMPRARVPKTLRGLGDRWVGANGLWIELPTGAAAPGGVKYGTFTLDEHGRMSDVNGPPSLSARRLDGKASAKGARQDRSSYASAAGPGNRVIHFWPTTISLPAPGCWALTEQLHDTTVRFVIRVGQASSPSAQDLVPALGMQQQWADVLPDNTQIARKAHLDFGSTRLLGTSGYGKHWVALDGEGNICLITQLDVGVSGHPGKDGAISGATCSPPQTFHRQGLSLEVGGEPGHGAVAYLLPPDIDASSLKTAVHRLNTDSGANAEVIRRDSSPLVVLDANDAATAGPIKIGRDDHQPEIVLQSP